MLKKFIIIALFSLPNCAQNHVEITAKTTEIFAQKNMSVKIYQTKNFAIFTAQKISDPKQDLRIYLEGDGKAYINEYQPSTNPTPSSYFLAKLIAQDDFPNIIYIARPCQYIESKDCEEKYWTNARFSQEIITSIDEVLQEFSDKKLQLIGYSGGGAIANYLTQHNKNIKSIRTIAGNLDHQRFCEIHEVPHLSDSLEPLKEISALEKIPQIHFVGTKDEIVPPIIAQEYGQKFLQKNCLKIIEVKNATHFKGWDLQWKDLLKIEPICTKNQT